MSEARFRGPLRYGYLRRLGFLQGPRLSPCFRCFFSCALVTLIVLPRWQIVTFATFGFAFVAAGGGGGWGAGAGGGGG